MILVTGGSGFAGSYLLYELCKTEEKVRAIKRTSTSLKQVKFVFGLMADAFAYEDVDATYILAAEELRESLFNKIEWVDADLNDEESLLAALDGITEVYHAAAEVSFVKKDAAKTTKTNVDGTALLVNLCLQKGIEKFCFFSSIASLNREDNKLTDEAMPDAIPDFSSVYSQTKYQAEMEVWRAMAEGLNAVIINPAVIIGAGDFSKGSIKIIDTLYHGLAAYPTGSTGFVDVRDVAKAAIQLMQTPKAFGQRYVLVSENVSYEYLFKNVCKEFNRKAPNIKAHKTLGYMAWAMLAIKAMVTGKPQSITKELVYTASKKFSFSNHKIKTEVGFNFTPISQTIHDACEGYLISIYDGF
ncbi:MAG: NAD-dependent epimerase/dehydratase family protein [Bacteroidetes bacterium]|nr:NAD-dependent epimerase/dehydratase family protein [Bacteroidota bacterium]